MKQYNLNLFISTFFLSFIILFSSCSQFYIDEENLEENLRVKATEIVSSINPDLITAEFFETLDLMIENDFHKKTSMEQANFLNRVNETKRFSSADIEQMMYNVKEVNKIQDQDELYKFAIENSELAGASKAMKLQIKELFELGNTEDNERIKSSLQNWSNKIKVNNNLTSEEKNYLVDLEATMTSFSQINDQIANVNFDEIGKRGPCGDCIKDNRRAIFGWGAVLAAILVIGCIIGTAGSAIALCIIALFPFSVLVMIGELCGEVCEWI